MPKLNLQESLIVFFASPSFGSDAPSFIFTPHGIKPVPGWGEEIVADLSAAAALHVQAGQFKGSSTVKREMEALANKIVQGRADEIREYAQQIAG